jgi:hypothetical protein
MVSEFEHTKRVIQKTTAKHDRDGIMRRNNLLLEHILMDRMKTQTDTRNYFNGEINVEDRFTVNKTKEKPFEHKQAILSP